MSSNNKLLGIFLIACAISWLTPNVQAKGTEPPKAETKPAQADSEPQKPLTDADYIAPLDNYLKDTPMAGTGRAFWEAEKRYGVSKELLMSIAYAETSYNRNPQRGSRFNAFSICSHDSTSTTCEYGSYDEAINAAAYWLTDPKTPIGSKGYTTVGQLSRFGNPHGTIWASSASNWNRNTTSELSRIHGKPVDHAYGWRR